MNQRSFIAVDNDINIYLVNNNWHYEHKKTSKQFVLDFLEQFPNMSNIKARVKKEKMIYKNSIFIYDNIKTFSAVDKVNGCTKNLRHS